MRNSIEAAFGSRKGKELNIGQTLAFRSYIYYKLKTSEHLRTDSYIQFNIQSVKCILREQNV